MGTIKLYFIWLLTMLLLIFESTVFADGISTLKLEMAKAQLPLIRIYADLLDQKGVALEDINNISITGTIGNKELKIEEIKKFDIINEGIAYIFLIDVSKSLKPNQFHEMRSAIVEFLNSMDVKDRAAILSFGSNVKIQSDFTTNKEKLKEIILKLEPIDNQTQLNLGLLKAIELGRRTDKDIPQRRVIITLTDGKD
ncbi:MAG: VWA domain-containing protein, partial [Nitrospirae bacterium]|nr:VWA domain-containing protein [Nitrospirota bacterium]